VRRVFGLLVVVVAAAMASLAAAAILPGDQSVAERLTLQLSDFPSAWTTTGPPSTRPGKAHCTTEPQLDRALTGYSDSADFAPIAADVDKRFAGSTTRVFATSAAAETWYRWLANGTKSACDLSAAVASWKRNQPDFRVSLQRHLRETFPVRCSSCGAYRSSTWRWGFTVSKPGQNDTTYVFDSVAVRRGRVVISFAFFSVDTPFGASGPHLVSKVLARG
jgi:hypothetical protein